MEDVPLWLQITVAVATVFAALTALASAISSGVSSRAAVAAQADANAAWKKSAEALDEANKLTRDHHAEAANERARVRRGPLAAVLLQFADATLMARVAGKGSDEITAIRIAAISEILPLQTAADEPTSQKLSRWVTLYSTLIPLEGVDVPAFSRLSTVLAQRVLAWVEDPDTAMRAIRADPVVLADTELNPDDPWDFRIP